MITYTPDLDARILRYRASGMSHREIAASIGSTKGSVGGRLRTLTLAGKLPATEKKPVFWTPEKIAEFRELWMTRTDLTRRQIGEKLGCTMDAVIGQLDRLDLPRRKGVVPIRDTISPVAEVEDIAWQPIAAPFDPPLRRARQCWQPLWSDVPTHEYCGGTQVAGRSYCAEHCRVVFATDHWRRAAASAGM